MSIALMIALVRAIENTIEGAERTPAATKEKYEGQESPNEYQKYTCLQELRIAKRDMP